MEGKKVMVVKFPLTKTRFQLLREPLHHKWIVQALFDRNKFYYNPFYIEFLFETFALFCFSPFLLLNSRRITEDCKSLFFDDWGSRVLG